MAPGFLASAMTRMAMRSGQNSRSTLIRLVTSFIRASRLYLMVGGWLRGLPLVRTEVTLEFTASAMTRMGTLDIFLFSPAL